MYIATLGLFVVALAVVMLVWRPTRDANELVGLILVIASIVGLGMLVSGSLAALSKGYKAESLED